MISVKGIYNQGMIDLAEKPKYKQPIEVLIIFPEEKNKGIKNIGGKFKNYTIENRYVT